MSDQYFAGLIDCKNKYYKQKSVWTQKWHFLAIFEFMLHSSFIVEVIGEVFTQVHPGVPKEQPYE